MPKTDGFTVLERLRNANLPPFIVVALTAYGDAKTVAHCKAAGLDHHVLKPASMDRLRELIEEARSVAA